MSDEVAAPHLVSVTIGGWDKFGVLCEDCLFRDGPYDEEIHPELSVV